MKNLLHLRTVGFGAILSLAACTDSPTHLELVPPRLEVDERIAAEFIRLLDGASDLRLSFETGIDPSLPALDALLTGEADLAFVSNFEAYRPGVSTVMPLYSSVLHIAHRPGAAPPRITDLLVEQPVYAGPPGSSTRLFLKGMVGELGLRAEDLQFAEEGACAEVFVVFAPILRDLPERLAGCGDYVLASLGTPEELGSGGRLDAINLLNPKLRPFVIPAGTYGALTPTAIVTIAVEKLLVSRADIPGPVIYDLISEILRQKPALSALHPELFNDLDGDFDADSVAFVLHPGARAYLDRNEPDIYERYSGVAELGVTLLIGLISGLYGIARIFSVRRKNRIDHYYTDAIEIRNRGRASTDAAQLEQAISELQVLQDRAFDQLVGEKLAANESFRIFITLAQDSVRELKSCRTG